MTTGQRPNATTLERAAVASIQDTSHHHVAPASVPGGSPPTPRTQPQSASGTPFLSFNTPNFGPSGTSFAHGMPPLHPPPFAMLPASVTNTMAGSMGDSANSTRPSTPAAGSLAGSATPSRRVAKTHNPYVWADGQVPCTPAGAPTLATSGSSTATTAPMRFAHRHQPVTAQETTSNGTSTTSTIMVAPPQEQHHHHQYPLPSYQHHGMPHDLSVAQGAQPSDAGFPAAPESLAQRYQRVSALKAFAQPFVPSSAALSSSTHYGDPALLQWPQHSMMSSSSMLFTGSGAIYDGVYAGSSSSSTACDGSMDAHSIHHSAGMFSPPPAPYGSGGGDGYGYHNTGVPSVVVGVPPPLSHHHQPQQQQTHPRLDRTAAGAHEATWWAGSSPDAALPSYDVATTVAEVTSTDGGRGAHEGTPLRSPSAQSITPNASFTASTTAHPNPAQPQTPRGGSQRSSAASTVAGTRVGGGGQPTAQRQGHGTATPPPGAVCPQCKEDTRIIVEPYRLHVRHGFHTTAFRVHCKRCLNTTSLPLNPKQLGGA